MDGLGYTFAMKARRHGALLALLPSKLSDQRPKGAQLQEILEGFIETLEPGGRLPAERLLAERYGVARATVTQAIEELAGKGLVYRVHGSGTFVAEPKFRQPQTLTSFTEDMRARGMTPGSIVLTQELIPASRRAASRAWRRPTSAACRCTPCSRSAGGCG